MTGNDPHADLARAISGNSSPVLAVITEGVVDGTAMAGHGGYRGCIYHLAVRPGRRGSGPGRELMRASEHRLEQRGVPKVQLMVRRTNGTVVSFYESLGYQDSDVVVLSTFHAG